MKRIAPFFLLLLAINISASSQIKTPSPSPTATIHQDFGLAAIDLAYSRPGMKGRKIFGDLVPYGKVWRTGANSATTLTFGDDVIIGGTKISAGKYGLVTIPGADSWTIIITKQTDITNPAAYKAENDVAHVTATTHKLNSEVETFTMEIEDVMPTSCMLCIRWATTEVCLPISTDIDTKVMMEIDTAIIGKNPPYYQAASYYFTNNKDMGKAEQWAQKATETNPDAFYMFYLLAEIEAKNGEKAKAIATAQKSIELSQKAQNSDYVTLNQKLIKSLQ